jgi:pteridine reductase
VMKQSDERKTALVTGAARRIGREIALALGGAGFNVCVHCNHSIEEARRTAEDIEELGVRSEVIQADFRDLCSFERLKDVIVRQFGRLDLLVNNASAYPGSGHVRADGGLLVETAEHFDEMFETNVRGPFFLIQRLAPLLEESGDGQIINICDRAGREPYLSRAAYSISRAAFNMLGTVARESLRGIRVNNIELGWVLPDDAVSENERLGRIWAGVGPVIEAALQLACDTTVNDRTIKLG